MKPNFQTSQTNLLPNSTSKNPEIIYNIDFAEQTNDTSLFKKLQNDIWKFRTKYAGLQIRLLEIWEKTDNKEALVIATHGLEN